MLKGFEDFGESLVEELSGFFADVFGDAVVGFCHAACDGGEGIAVASYGDGGADSVFKGFGFEEGFDGLGDGVLAGFVEFVGGADGMIQQERQNNIINILGGHSYAM